MLGSPSVFLCVQVCACMCGHVMCMQMHVCMCVLTQKETETDKASGQGAETKLGVECFDSNLS